MTGQDDTTNTKLDSLLQKWSEECAIDWASDADLRRAIMARMPRHQSSFVKARQSWSALAACASVLVLLIATTLISLPQRFDSQLATAKSAVVSPVGLTALWGHTADVFGPQLNWLCDLDGELLIGVDQALDKKPVHDRAMILLTLRVRETRSAQWSAVWTGRVVCPLGQLVDFISDKTHSGGSVWVQALPDGRFVASHWLNWPEHPEISGSVETEFLPGEAQVVSEQIVDGRSIQIVQQVFTYAG